MKSLLIRGPFRGPTGYDRCVRGFARALHDQGVAVELRDIPEWSAAKLPEAAQDPLFASLERPLGNAQTVLQFCTPLGALLYPGKINVNYTMFEADRVLPAWVEANRRHDLVVVPAESSRSAWIHSGMPAHRILICPPGVNAAAFSNRTEPMSFVAPDGLSIAGYRVRFLNVSELCWRKNLLGLLHAWIEGTSAADDAVLIVKVGSYGLGSWEGFLQRVDRLRKSIGKGLPDAAPVVFLRGTIADAEIPRLYALATHYMTLSFGEGWDLPTTEAAAAGLKIIAPAHSAYLAYLDSSIATLIPSREVPAQDPENSGLDELFRGANWWEPDRACAIEAIRAAIENRDSHARSARARILGQFTWENAARRLAGILDERESLRAKIPQFSSLRSNTGANTEKTHSPPDAPPGPNPS